jgi:hypothetical protein
MIEPCCERIASLVNVKGIGLSARLPKEPNPEKKRYSPMYLHFRSVERGHLRKITVAANGLDVPLLIYKLFEINFCPFCGYDWREYSLESFQRLQESAVA